MIRDESFPDDLSEDGLGEATERPSRGDGSFSDREVPIGPARLTIADAVHAWLDGEASEDSARRLGSAEDVEFWKRLDGAMRAGRRQSAPPRLQARVLAAIRQLED